MAGGPVVLMKLSIPLPCYGEIIQKLVALHILNQTSQISRGESPCYFICEIIGSTLLVEEQYSILQDFTSYLDIPTTIELGLDRLQIRVYQHPP